MTGCSILNCGGTHYARGWCRKHYLRWRNHGDPSIVHKPNWTGDAATYQAMHIRVMKARGRARDHNCIDCDGSAAQWSYVRDCSTERTDPERRGAPYCLHVEHYAPRCISCHKRFDLAASPRRR